MMEESDGPAVKTLAIGIDTRVARIVQRAHGGRCGQRLEDDLFPIAESRWEEKALPGEHLDGLRGRSHPRECLEEVGDQLPDLGIRIKNNVAELIIDEAGWQRTPIFTAAHRVEDSAA